MKSVTYNCVVWKRLLNVLLYTQPANPKELSLDQLMPIFAEWMDPVSMGRPEAAQHAELYTGDNAVVLEFFKMLRSDVVAGASIRIDGLLYVRNPLELVVGAWGWGKRA